MQSRKVSIVFTLIVIQMLTCTTIWGQNIQNPVLNENVTIDQTISHPPYTFGYYLTIWCSTIRNQHPYGSWDYNTLPDPQLYVSHAEKVIYTASKQKDILTPQWNAVIAHFTTQDFDQGPIIVHIYDQDVVGRELIEEITVPRPREEIIGKNIRLQGDFITLFLQWQVDIHSSSVMDLSDETISYHKYPQWINRTKTSQLKTSQLNHSSSNHISSSDQSSQSNSQTNTTQQDQSITIHKSTSSLSQDQSMNTVAKQRDGTQVTFNQTLREKDIQGQRLFKQYLQAYFEGDQIHAHHLLLELSVRFAHTSHGRKARRLLLLASH